MNHVLRMVYESGGESGGDGSGLSGSTPVSFSNEHDFIRVISVCPREGLIQSPQSTAGTVSPDYINVGFGPNRL
jgi:hypothetical protein